MNSQRGVFVLAIAIASSGCVCTRAEPPPPAPKSLSNVNAMTKTELHCQGALLATREGGSDPGRYVEPSEAERDALRDAIATLTATDPKVATLSHSIAAAQPSLTAAGFEAISIEGTSTVLVREAGRRRGGGAYLVRPAGASNVAVQAPHTFFDEGTLPLACELFERAQALALFIDTAHRYKAAEDAGADVAHVRDSFFQSATRGLLMARPRGIVVQLHGFAERKGGAAIVLSGGVKTMGVPIVSRVHTALLSVVPGGVARFPEESSELGATTNVQGDIVREAGGQFLHVEIAAPLRRDLLSNPTLRASVLTSLANALEGA
ncbi:MAG: hypothetical protein ACXVEF_16660 [Polyangiales bacterium]